LGALCPYVEQDAGSLVKQVFADPADRTIDEAALRMGVCSYASNSQAFRKGANLNSTFADGLSGTLMFAEHYGRCDGVRFVWYDTTTMMIEVERYSSFGDAVYPDQPLTFQVTPCPERGPGCPLNESCNVNLAQTAHEGAMPVALADGSIRRLAKGMSPRTYWGAVTPDGGEVFGDDW
jgi:hypothetical protein